MAGLAPQLVHFMPPPTPHHCHVSRRALADSFRRGQGSPLPRTTPSSRHSSVGDGAPLLDSKPVGIREEDGRIPGARSPTNLSSRYRILLLHGRIQFSLTRSSHPEGGSTTPKSGLSWCAWLRRRRPPPSQAAGSDGQIDGPGIPPRRRPSRWRTEVTPRRRRRALGVPDESFVWYNLCRLRQQRHHWCRVPRWRC